MPLGVASFSRCFRRRQPPAAITRCLRHALIILIEYCLAIKIFTEYAELLRDVDVGYYRHLLRQFAAIYAADVSPIISRSDVCHYACDATFALLRLILLYTQ